MKPDEFTHEGSMIHVQCYYSIEEGRASIKKKKPAIQPLRPTK